MTGGRIRVIDASDSVLGRVASATAKRLMNNETVHIVNAEKIVVTGRNTNIMEKYNTRRNLSTKGNPHFGPKFPRTPIGIVKRTVRGMLPWKKPTGKKAFKRLRVHIGVPGEFKDTETEKILGTENRLKKGFMSVGEISRSLGARWRG